MTHIHGDVIPVEYDTCPVCHGKGLMQGDGCGWDGASYHDPGCKFCAGEGAVPKPVAEAYRGGAVTDMTPDQDRAA